MTRHPLNEPEYEFQKYATVTQRLIEAYAEYLIAERRTSDVVVEAGPQYADFDYRIFVDGSFDHYIELKFRYHPQQQFPDTKVPVRKHAFAEHVWRRYGHKTYLLVQWSDGKCGLLDLVEEPDREETVLSRHDRVGDGEAMETASFYDVRRFKMLPLLVAGGLLDENR